MRTFLLLSIALMGCRTNGTISQDTADIDSSGDADTDSDSDSDTDTDTDSDSDSDTDTDSDSDSDTSVDPSDVDDDNDGMTENEGDCDDADPNTYDGATEICDSKDNDCDGTDDEDTAAVDWYADSDNDGFGDEDATAQSSCSPISGSVQDDTDCDDANPAMNPGATDICDTLDNDCDGTPDNGPAPTWYADDDSDGQGDAGDAMQACTRPDGYVSSDTDCNDADGTIYEGADELCDSKDNDCDGSLDEDTAPVDWYPDTDSDGFGDEDATPQNSCQPVSGSVTNAGDCDDTNNAVNPNAADVCDGIDNDCSGDADTGLGAACTCQFLDEGECASDTDCAGVMGFEADRAVETCLPADQDVAESTASGTTQIAGFAVNWNYTLKDRVILPDLVGDDLDATPVDSDTFTLDLTFDAALNTQADPFEVDAAGGLTNVQCTGWVDPMQIDADISYDIVPDGAGGITVNWTTWNWSYTLPNNPWHVAGGGFCSVQAVNGVLQLAGTTLEDAILDANFDAGMDAYLADVQADFEVELKNQWAADTYLGCLPTADCSTGVNWTDDSSSQTWGTLQDCMPTDWTAGADPTVNAVSCVP